MAKPYTKEEIAIICAGLKNGLRSKEIALALPGRSVASVDTKCSNMRYADPERLATLAAGAPPFSPPVRGLDPDDPGIPDYSERDRREQAIHGDALFAARMTLAIRHKLESAPIGVDTTPCTRAPRFVSGSAGGGAGSPAALCADQGD